jgi:hypothetical protein
VATHKPPVIPGALVKLQVLLFTTKFPKCFCTHGRGENSLEDIYIFQPSERKSSTDIATPLHEGKTKMSTNIERKVYFFALEYS